MLRRLCSCFMVVLVASIDTSINNRALRINEGDAVIVNNNHQHHQQQQWLTTSITTINNNNNNNNNNSYIYWQHSSHRLTLINITTTTTIDCDDGHHNNHNNQVQWLLHWSTHQLTREASGAMRVVQNNVLFTPYFDGAFIMVFYTI
jgi:hypothetical protein